MKAEERRWKENRGRWALEEGKKGHGGEYDQSTLHTPWKCHNSAHYYAQLTYAKEHTPPLKPGSAADPQARSSKASFKLQVQTAK